VLVKKVYLVARSRQLLAAHCAGRSTADDRYLSHVLVSLSAIIPSLRAELPPCLPSVTGPNVMGR
jgi:hypothetical protein